MGITGLSRAIRTVAERTNANEPRPSKTTEGGSSEPGGRPPAASGSTEERLLNQATFLDAAAGGGSSPLSAIQSFGIAPAEDSPEAIVDRVFESSNDPRELPSILARELSGLDADDRAAVIAEITARDDNTFAPNHWLNPATLQERVWDGSLSESDAAILADSIASAWNRDLVPTFEVSSGEETSYLDSFGNQDAPKFSLFFNASTSVEVNAFRLSYSQHLYDTYASPNSPFGEYSDVAPLNRESASLVAAHLVTAPGIISSVTADFYTNTFGSNGSSEFAQFITHATLAYSRNPVSGAHDPFIAFANFARDPGPYQYNVDEASAREGVAVGLAESIGLADTDPGVFGVDKSGVLAASSDEVRDARLEVAVEVFDDHTFAILNHLASGQGNNLDPEGKIDTTHPALTNFFRFTVGNTDLENREVARDAASRYFDHQVDTVLNDPDGVDRPSELRAINIASAASLSTQNIIADEKAVIAARRGAATFILDTALSFIPLDRGRSAVVDSLTSHFGGSLPPGVVEKIADELLTVGTNRLTSATREDVLDLLIQSGGVRGRQAAGQEFVDITLNRLETILDIESTADLNGNGVLDGDTERTLSNIIDMAVLKANVG